MRKVVQRKHISDREILEAAERFHSRLDLLSRQTPEQALADKYPPNVVLAKMARLEGLDYLEVGVSLRTAWLSQKGKMYLEELRQGCKL